MEILAIIPARGGSKGIPRKNVLPLAGKPLIAHNIAAALASHLVTRVVVSTDDAEIAAVARDHGAEVVMRPDALAGDVARSEDALLHVLDTLEEAEGYRPKPSPSCNAPPPSPRPRISTARWRRWRRSRPTARLPSFRSTISCGPRAGMAAQRASITTRASA